MKYQKVINKTLSDNLLIQAGRANEVYSLSVVEKLAVKAFQRAENKTIDDEIKSRKTSSN